MHRATAWTRPGQIAGLGAWTALWDRDTDVPLRMWGNGDLVPGSVADAAIAEAAARSFLAAHIHTLAPGSSVGDFELVSNTLGGSGDVRSVGFAQRANGVRVLGGAVGFAFKRDRLAMVNSTALPHVVAPVSNSRLARQTIERAAQRWLADDGHTVAAKSVAGLVAPERVIVPIVRPRTGAKPSIIFRVAEPIAVKATKGHEAWQVWIDANDGSPIARQSTIHYASARVLFDVSDRRPGDTRTNQPAANAQFQINNVATIAALDGTVTWAGTAPGTAILAARGKLAAVTNEAGAAFTQTVTLQPNSVLNLSRAAVEFDDAQLTSYIHADAVKRFVKARLNPTLPYLDQVLPVHVNLDDTCNAFSTGDDINFFRSSQQCENTGRMADVVYHEFGHSLHANSIIEGVGNFDGSLSEGISDTLSLAMTGDAGMGRGFFHSNNALRDLDHTQTSGPLCHPAGTVMKLPDDATGESHNDGEIIGGALSDLRKALEAKHGAQAGFDAWLPIMYTMFQRASDLTSTYPEALLADDDDGNLANGSPNQCEITAAFGRHGLADPSLTLGIGIPTRDNFTVSLVTTPPATACPGASVDSATIDWRPRGGTGGQVTLTKSGDTFTGDIPNQPEGTVVEYKVTVALSDGSSISYPQNPADQFYQFYVGPVTPLYCNDFEAGAADWTKTPDWEVGAPAGLATDPTVAFGGTGVFGMDLTDDGVYRPRAMSVAESPEIDLQGNTVVRLQYQRWLGVEDAFYDNARIFANGVAVYNNFASPSDPQTGGVNHVDREWRFHDVDLSAVAAASTNGKIKLSFILESDEGLEFGGWTIDDFCVVALSGAALTCGNNTTDDGETCDDGNRVDGDGCSANCQSEDGDGDGGGCCSTSNGAEGALALSSLTLGALFLRRRRRS